MNAKLLDSIKSAAASSQVAQMKKSSLVILGQLSGPQDKRGL
jgi:hypothetical protein